jgi:DNA-binding transcriptional ArsR family regulator
MDAGPVTAERGSLTAASAGNVSTAALASTTICGSAQVGRQTAVAPISSTTWRSISRTFVSASAVGELVRRLGLTQSNLSRHLAMLRKDGLVATRREGTVIHYRIASDRVRPILAELYRLFCAPGEAAPSGN